jgi:hypothetical protein
MTTSFSYYMDRLFVWLDARRDARCLLSALSEWLPWENITDMCSEKAARMDVVQAAV